MSIGGGMTARSHVCESRWHDLPVTSCQLCGRPIDEHERHVRYRQPERVLQLPEQEQTDGVWMSGNDPDAEVMMMAPNLGGFVRALLPVRLTGEVELALRVTMD